MIFNFKKVTSILASAVMALLFTTGCTYKSSVPSIQTMDLTQVDFSQSSTWKKAESCRSNFLIFPTGLDKSIKDAAVSAGINKVEYTEYEYTNFLLGQKDCVTVYGK